MHPNLQHDIDELKQQLQALEFEENNLQRKLGAVQRIASRLDQELARLATPAGAEQVEAPHPAPESTSDEELEVEILELLALHHDRGMSSQEIARRLCQSKARIDDFMVSHVGPFRRRDTGTEATYFMP
ncbi:MAG TPA: hypothetical protein VHY22_17450 [Chthoniobacteraceae bacterium]|jgi:DNA-binding NarL/FixJ family response regulator|nr:hypothetical protein [Chthoniobacteraceae bacterium]